ncbi:hypothetical protein FOFC_02893 [Fusarium oxysporum]|nr:hypothetical protein FOFC_02893 [Fusarium oxysporum]
METLSHENGDQIAKVAWLSRKVDPKTYGSMVVYLTKNNDAKRLLQTFSSQVNRHIRVNSSRSLDRNNAITAKGLVTDHSCAARIDLYELNLTQPVKTVRRARGKGGQGDQFCIHHLFNGLRIPASATEYKPPHKLSLNEIVTGLVSEIQPDRNVINQEGTVFTFAARRLTTAVVTQLFSYMVFLHIPDDGPTCVYYSVCVPSLDVQGDPNGADETRFYCTAVAQVFAFVLRTVQASPTTQAWHQAAEELDTWVMEYDDVLKEYTNHSTQGTAGNSTRSRCQPPTSEMQQPYRDSSSSDDDDDSPSPTPNPANRPPGGLAESKGTTSTEAQQQDDIQGTFIPVCLGIVDLAEPSYYDSGVYEHFMLLSYGGRPILKELAEIKPDVVDEIITVLGKLHQQHVLPHDAEPRNVLYDKRTGRCMIVDLMQAELHVPRPLGPIIVNSWTRKRKRAARKYENDNFAVEAQSLRALLLV